MPDLYEAHLNFDGALFFREDFEAAAGAFRKALAIQPESPLAYFNLATALEKPSKDQEAIETYRKVLQFAPDFTRANQNMGFTLEQAGDKTGRLLLMSAPSNFGLRALPCIGESDSSTRSLAIERARSEPFAKESRRFRIPVCVVMTCCSPWRLPLTPFSKILFWPTI